jgi:hypothetical protein
LRVECCHRQQRETRIWTPLGTNRPSEIATRDTGEDAVKNTADDPDRRIAQAQDHPAGDLDMGRTEA